MKKKKLKEKSYYISEIRDTKKLFLFFLTLLVFLGLVVTPLAVHSFFVPVQFNQFLIQKLELHYGVISPQNFFGMIESSYSSGLNYLSGTGMLKEPDYENTQEVFSYVYSWIPPKAVVYPTERFYYFNTKIGGQNVSGNIRVADIDNGKITLAYFKVGEIEKSTKYDDITIEDGLMINKFSNYLYEVSFNGKKVQFKIPTTDVSPPQKLKLLPQEEFVGHIHDESGIKFFFIFNNATESFYNILDEENGFADSLEQIDIDHFVGKRTGFVFYHDKDYNRKILIGVHIENIAENNYLDGPGDQVPIIIDIREKLHKAYPNTMLGDGIDEHGVYLNKPQWVRIAVTPFIRYSFFSDVIKRTSSCIQLKENKSEFWTCLTKEYWNTPQWRESIYEKLKAEGKPVD